jgi:hypothetical protein
MSVADDQLALLCAELPQLRSTLRTFPPRRELLEQAVQAGRRGEPVTRYLRRLGIAADDQPGTSGARKDSPAAVPWATGGGRSVPGAYVCPVDVCARWQYRQPGDDLPTCHLHDRPLRFEPDR